VYDAAITGESMRVTKAHVLVELACDRCNGLCERLTVAFVKPDGTIGMPMTPAGVIVCNNCEQKERDAERDAQEKSRGLRKEQSRWATGNIKQ
jgi:hypothetical protein